MKPEDQRIAIAEFCGLPYHKPTEAELASGCYYQYEPDYLSDLNLMHKAENIIIKKTARRQRYVAELRAVTADIDTWHATAAQRAEALLKAIGWWTDEP